MLLHAGASPWETVRFTLEVFARGKYARMLFSHRDKNPSNYGKPLLPLQPLDATASKRASERARTEAFVERGDNVEKESARACARARAEEVMQFPKELIQLFNRPLTKHSDIPIFLQR